MKKFFKFLLKVLFHPATIALTLCVGLVGFFVYFSILNTPIAKDYACKAYSAECELEKDRILIIPITFSPKIIDVYGSPIDRKINQWYVVSTKAKVLVPSYFPVCIGTDREGGCIYSYNPSPEEIKEHCTYPEIMVDTINVSSMVPGITQAAILVSGPNEFVCGTHTSAEVAIGKTVAGK